MEIVKWEGLRNGDPACLEWLYNRYLKLLYNYGKKMSVDEKSLEDAIHDLFVDLWKYRERLSPTTSVRFYLYRSLRRRLVRNDQHIRELILNVQPPEFNDSPVPCEEEYIIEKEAQVSRIRHLKRLLSDLSPRQYEAMVLRFYDELSFEEIGQILNVNEQSARNLVQRGLSQLKQFSRYLTLWAIFLALA